MIIRTQDPVHIGSLAEIDALVGRCITREQPRVFWEDSLALLRFDTRHEAIEVIGNPRYQTFVPAADWETGALRKVETFRRYSSDLAAAWEVVELLSVSKKYALTLVRSDVGWVASFNAFSNAASISAPLAICLAALMVMGIDFVIEPALDG